jgi:hypothetical protein
MIFFKVKNMQRLEKIVIFRIVFSCPNIPARGIPFGIMP